MFPTGTYTLSHARWDHLTNDEPGTFGITPEQVMEMCQAIDAEWERAVKRAGRAFQLELEVEWVEAYFHAHKLCLDDPHPLAEVIKLAVRDAVEVATDRVMDAWSKRHFSTK